MDKMINKYANLFDVLSNEVRLCIILNLCNTAEKNVGQLQKCTNASQSVVSQQLGKLKSLGIITSRKEGNEVHYAIADLEIKEMVNKLKIVGE